MYQSTKSGLNAFLQINVQSLLVHYSCNFNCNTLDKCHSNFLIPKNMAWYCCGGWKIGDTIRFLDWTSDTIIANVLDLVFIQRWALIILGSYFLLSTLHTYTDLGIPLWSAVSFFKYKEGARTKSSTKKRQKKSHQEITAAFPPTFYKYVSKEGEEIEGFWNYDSR